MEYRRLPTLTMHPFISKIKEYFMSPAAIAAIAALAIVLPGCSRSRNAAEEMLADDSELADQAITVDSCFTADTTFTFNGTPVNTLEIARIFPTEHDDVYISLRVFALRDTSEVNTALSRIISENYNEVSGGDLYFDRGGRSPQAVERQMDYYGKVFVDTILPQLKESVEYGFFMNMDLRPAWADGKGIITYSSFVESCGGAACDMDAYYVSFSTATGRQLGFDDLVSDPVTRLQIRETLVRQIAESRNLSTEQYLRQVTSFISPEAMNTLTPSSFPLGRVAIMGSRLIFSYPQGAIAPFREGCPIYSVELPQ